MGSAKDIKTYDLSKSITIKYLQDGNHDLKPRVKSGITLEYNIYEAVDNLIDFMRIHTK